MSSQSQTTGNDPCYECGNTGVLDYIVYNPFSGLDHQEFCSCPRGAKAFESWLLREDVQQAIRRKRKEKIESALKFSELPQKWEQKSLENLQGHEKLKQSINHYLDGFSKHQKTGRGMYLWSTGSGRGKTHALISLCKKIIDRFLVSCIFITEEQMLQKMRESFDKKSVFELERSNRFRQIPCLFLDDFGASKVTDWKTEFITALLDYRLNNALPTFFTSNYCPRDYEEMMKGKVSRPERIPSRIHEMCAGFIIEVKGEDFRKKLKPVLPQ